jgi:hypothetical protein
MYDKDQFTCSCCGEIKERSYYYNSKRYSTGIRQPCKECVKEKGKSKRKEYQDSNKYIPKTKVCGTCKEEKSSSEFNKRIDTPTGLRFDCKECQSLDRHENYEKNKDRVIERTGKYRLQHKEDYARWKRERRSRDLEGHLEKERLYREENKDYINAYSDRWRQENPEKVKASRKKYYYNNLEKLREKRRKWASENKDKVCYYASKRRAKVKNASPVWADQDTIRSFYKEAQYFEESVDHIIPLSHPLVCGLHVEFNLQTMPLRDNIIKNNDFEPCEHELPVWFEVEENVNE